MGVYWYDSSCNSLREASLTFESQRYGQIGNYDVTKLHYEGPGSIPGAPGGGYGYAVRTEGRSPSDAAATIPLVSTA